MKSHVVALLFVGLVTAASGQTFFIDWTKPNPVTGAPTIASLKREGLVKNSNAVTKELYFRYNLDELNPAHRAQLCMSLCWLLFPGEDNPYDREGQVLTPTSALPIYIDLTTNATEGNSTIKVTLFDKTDTTDKLDFDVQFVVSANTSVGDMAETGISMGPNPASNVLSLSGQALANVTSVGLYDLQGNIVRSYGTPAQTNVQYTLDGLSNGTYRLVLTMRDGSMRGSAVAVTR